MPRPVTVYIVGGPGGGKSTIAGQIAVHTGVQPFDLDNQFWKPGGPKSAAEREVEMATIMSAGPWVAEGIYSDWADTLMREADVILWVEVPLPVAIWRVVTRHVKASLTGTNRYPGLIRLGRFVRTTMRYHLSNKVAGVPSETADWTRRSTGQSLARYQAKVIGRDVRSWVARLDREELP
jgi:adenylate kinase family enzyme